MKALFSAKVSPSAPAQPIGRSRFAPCAAILAPCILALAGCGGEAKAPGQVVAKGDNFEITVQEFDQTLRQIPPVTREAVAPMRRSVLDNLISEKLLAEAAQNANLDKDMAVSQDLEAARRAVMARAYVRSLVGAAYQPDDSAIAQFYNAHPAQFAQRQRLTLNELAIDADTPHILAYVKSFDAGGLATLGKALVADGMAVTPAPVQRFTDEVMGDSARQAAQMSPGARVTYQTQSKLHFAEVGTVSPAPLPLDSARPRITAALIAERNIGIVKGALAKIKEDRHVTIVKDGLRALASN